MIENNNWIEYGWISLSDKQPADGEVVDTCIIEGDYVPITNEQTLKKSGPLWFFPDSSMYVYYTPTHWKLKH